MVKCGGDGQGFGAIGDRGEDWALGRWGGLGRGVKRVYMQEWKYQRRKLMYGAQFVWVCEGLYTKSSQKRSGEEGKKRPVSESLGRDIEF